MLFLNLDETRAIENYSILLHKEQSQVMHSLVEEANNHYLFAPSVYLLMLPDVINLFGSYDDIITIIVKTARIIIREDRLFPDIRNIPIPCAVFVCWLNFFCNYKTHGRVKDYCGEDRDFMRNKKALQEVVFSDCFNYGTGYKTGKAKKMETLYRECKKQYSNCDQNSNIPAEMFAFFELLHMVGFSYSMY